MERPAACPSERFCAFAVRFANRCRKVDVEFSCLPLYVPRPADGGQACGRARRELSRTKVPQRRSLVTQVKTMHFEHSGQCGFQLFVGVIFAVVDRFFNLSDPFGTHFRRLVKTIEHLAGRRDFEFVLG